MDLFVPAHAIDYDEVFRRGGRGFGDEDFALFKCPNCWQVYLADLAADVVYTNPKDLAVRTASARVVAACVGCGSPLPRPWVGPDAPQATRLTWDQLYATPWAWVASAAVMVRKAKLLERER